MALFVTKEWKDRLVEFAGRRKLKNVSTNVETVFDVFRNEGAVSQEGDAFSAKNMNDLEQRIKNGFDKVDSNLTADGLQFKFRKDGEGNYGFLGADGSLIPFRSGFNKIVSAYAQTGYGGYNNTFTYTKSIAIPSDAKTGLLIAVCQSGNYDASINDVSGGITSSKTISKGTIKGGSTQIGYRFMDCKFKPGSNITVTFTGHGYAYCLGAIFILY